MKEGFDFLPSWVYNKRIKVQEEDFMIDKTMTIREVLNIDPGTAHIMMSFGMHCLTCPCATAESLEEAAMVHGINVDEMVDQLNAYLAEKQ